MAMQEVFPHCCIQFEDFANFHAVPLLARYRDRVCCYSASPAASACRTTSPATTYSMPPTRL